VEAQVEAGLSSLRMDRERQQHFQSTLLADALDTIRALVLYGRVPPVPKVNDVVAGGKREQAEILAEGGVDLLALEMCEHPEASPLAVEAALATGLPVWVGLSCKRDPETDRLVGFDSFELDFDFESLIGALAAYDIGVINVMHSSIEDTVPCLEAVKRQWAGPRGAYPESGYFKAPRWEFTDIIEPDDLVSEARTWIDGGVQLIGGCCGLGPRHIAALNEAFGT
ncbi:MAG: homocysteine S-methyltransferase family protein, partial [Gammaproteobacteria bacterium]